MFHIKKAGTHGQLLKNKYLSALLLVVAVSFSLVAVSMQSVGAATVKQVSTGDTSACAAIDGWVKCWGSNSSGQLGNGDTTDRSTPTAVANNKNALEAVTHCASTGFGGRCTRTVVDSPAIPASALAGRFVEKVSVGKNHACALADAKVYCWGNNSSGQLGNNTTTSTTVPVSVYTQTGFTEHVAASCNGTTFFGICFGTKIPAHDEVRPASAIRNKEVIDIAAGDSFTCALASDGTVSCWGLGNNGRLGTNSMATVRYPTAVYTGSVLANKKGIRLAKAAGATMCVIAVDKSNTDAATGTPYCWGLGVGNGSVPPSKTVKCSSTTSKTQGQSTTTVYFDSAAPVNGAGVIAMMKNIDIAGTNRITGIGNDSRAYYWGLNGYVATVTVSTPKCTHTSSSGSNGLDSGGKKCGGGSNHGSPGCGSRTVTVTNYTEYYTYTPVGSVTAKGPVYNSGAPLGLKSFSAASGNAYDGLFCGVVDTGAYCDSHGTGMGSGQTGSGYTQHCTTVSSGFLGLFKTTVCDPDPAGPQTVVSSGWLAGKTITSLSTGASGYTCAIANDSSLACWGANSSGQLGVGDKNNRNVPTAVINL